MLFRDRVDAGKRLANALSYLRTEKCLVLALPRGGVPVAAEVAKALGAPLDLILVRKIGAPRQPELAIGAVVDGASPTVIRSPEIMRHLGISDAQFEAICAREREEIERRRKTYFVDAAPLDPKGRVAIVIDDGVATGATMRAALKATRLRGPKKLIMAVPVASQDAIAELSKEADAIVCLASPEPFGSVGAFYDEFDQLEDEEVMATLRPLRQLVAAERG